MGHNDSEAELLVDECAQFHEEQIVTSVDRPFSHCRNLSILKMHATFHVPLHPAADLDVGYCRTLGYIEVVQRLVS